MRGDQLDPEGNELKTNLVLPGVSHKILIDFMKHEDPDAEDDHQVQT